MGKYIGAFHIVVVWKSSGHNLEKKYKAKDK